MEKIYKKHLSKVWATILLVFCAFGTVDAYNSISNGTIIYAGEATNANGWTSWETSEAGGASMDLKHHDADNNESPVTLDFDVTVATAGTYNIEAYGTTCHGGTHVFSFYIDNMTTPVGSVSYTSAGSSGWAIGTRHGTINNVNLCAGAHKLRIYYPGNSGGGVRYSNAKFVFQNSTTTGCSATTVAVSGASNITATSATLNGTVASIETVTARGFRYGTTNPGTPNNITYGAGAGTGSGTGSFSANLTGLTTGTTYYYYAYATSNGVTYYSTVQTFKPQACNGTGFSICMYSDLVDFTQGSAQRETNRAVPDNICGRDGWGSLNNNPIMHFKVPSGICPGIYSVSLLYASDPGQTPTAKLGTTSALLNASFNCNYKTGWDSWKYTDTNNPTIAIAGEGADLYFNPAGMNVSRLVFTPVCLTPVATAGSNKTTTAGISIALDAIAAGTGNTGAWTIQSKAAGSNVTVANAISLASSATATFTPDVAGSYTLRWTVTTNTGGCSAYSEITVTATACAALTLPAIYGLTSTADDNTIRGTHAYGYGNLIVSGYGGRGNNGLTGNDAFGNSLVNKRLTSGSAGNYIEWTNVHGGDGGNFRLRVNVYEGGGNVSVTVNGTVIKTGLVTPASSWSEYVTIPLNSSCTNTIRITCSAANAGVRAIEISEAPACNQPAAKTLNNPSICSGSTAVITVASPENGVTYALFNKTTSAQIGSNVKYTGSGNVEWTTAALTANTTYVLKTVEVDGYCAVASMAESAVTIKAATAITTSLVDKTITEFDAIPALAIVASGSGTLTYKWYKDGSTTAISGATTASYTPTTAGTYKVEVTGECGTQSSTAVLTINNVAKLVMTNLTPATNTVLSAGSTLTVSVTITNQGHAAQAGTYRVAFRFNGTTKNIDTNSTLGAGLSETVSTTYTVPTTNGTYTFRATYGSVILGDYTIVVNDGTEVDTDPAKPTTSAYVCGTQDYYLIKTVRYSKYLYQETVAGPTFPTDAKPLKFNNGTVTEVTAKSDTKYQFVITNNTSGATTIGSGLHTIKNIWSGQYVATFCWPDQKVDFLPGDNADFTTQPAKRNWTFDSNGGNIYSPYNRDNNEYRRWYADGDGTNRIGHNSQNPVNWTENSNARQFEFIKYTAAGNLQVSAVTIAGNKTQAAVNESFQATATVKNVGDAAIPAGQVVKMKFIHNGKIVRSSYTVPSGGIIKNATFNVTVTITPVKVTTNADSKIIKVTANSDWTVPECNYDDNQHLTTSIEVVAERIKVTSITLTAPGNIWSASVGALVQVTANALPENADDKSVTWSSSNPAIATVSASGLVAAIAPGQITITATAKDGSNVTGTHTFTVKLAAPVLTVTPGATSALVTWAAVPSATSYTLFLYSSQEPLTPVAAYNGVTTSNTQYTFEGLTAGETYYVQAKAMSSVLGSEGDSPLSTIVPFTTKVAATSITVVPDTAWTNIGKTIQFAVSTLPQGASNLANWTSDNTSVATVNNATGLVTATGLGKTYIRASSVENVAIEDHGVLFVRLPDPEVTGLELKNGAVTISWNPVEGADSYTVYFYNAECAIVSQAYTNATSPYVIPGIVPGTYNYKVIAVSNIPDANSPGIECHEFKYVAVADLTLSGCPTNGELRNGSTLQLTATVIPSTASNKKIIWSSGNATVATVDQAGLVRGVKEGLVTITAKTEDGNIEKVCNLTITQAIVGGIEMRKSIYIILGDNSKTLTAIVSPEEAPNKNVTWTSSDPTVATVDVNGKITTLKKGETIIKATADADAAVFATCTVYVVDGGNCPEETYATFVDGPFSIKNYWRNTYLYDDKENNTLTEVNSAASPSDGTEYSNMGYVKQGTSLLETDEAYFWNLYSKKIGSNTYYMLRNMATGRYMHAGVFADYYPNNGNNNSLNTYEWNSALIGSATAIDATDNSTKELSYYMFTLPAYTSDTRSVAGYTGVKGAAFEAPIQGKRFVYGDRRLHAEHNYGAGAKTYFTDNANGWDTKTWVFTPATSISCGATEIINVTGITLIPAEATVTYSETLDLTATVIPANATYKGLIWTSSDQNVAKVDNTGRVTGIGSGVATITVTTKDGGLTATSIITVKAACEPIVARTLTAPNISNAAKDPIWDNTSRKAISQQVTLLTTGGGGNEGATNIPTNIPAGYWRAMFDDTNLYFLVEVLDENPWHNTGTVHHGDGVEFYLDSDNNANLTGYSANQHQTAYNYIGTGSISAATYGVNSIAGSSTYKVYRTNEGYNVQVAFPWSAIGGVAKTQGGIRMDICINQTDQASGTTYRRAQISTFANTMALYDNPSWFTYVPFFEIKASSTMMVEEGVDTELAISTSQAVDNITWESNPAGNDGTGHTNTVNQLEDTKYTVTAEITGCASTTAIIDAKLSNVYLHGDLTGNTNDGAKNLATEASGNRMIPINCNGSQGSYTGEYYLLWKVASGSTKNIKSVTSVWDMTRAVSVTVTGNDYSLTGAGDSWVRWIYDQSGAKVHPAAMAYKTDEVYLVTNQGDRKMTRTSNSTYTVTVPGSALTSYTIKAIDPKGAWNSTIWAAAAATFSSVNANVKFTWNYATNCLSYEVLTKYRLVIDGNPSNVLEGDGNFTLNIPCSGGVAQLQYLADGSSNWQNAVGYIIDLTEYFGQIVEIPFTYNKLYYETKFGNVNITGVSSGISIANIANVSGAAAEISAVGKVTGITANANYQWRESTSPSMVPYKVVGNSDICSVRLIFEETKYYQLVVTDGYCRAESNVITVSKTISDVISPDIAINHLYEDLGRNKIVLELQNWGNCNLFKNQYQVTVEVVEIETKTLTIFKLNSTSNPVVPDLLTAGGIKKVEIDYTFDANRAYVISAELKTMPAFATNCGTESNLENNKYKISVCTFDRNVDTIQYYINNTFVNNVDSLCSLRFKTLMGAIEHLKSDDGFIKKNSTSATANELTRHIVFNVTYTGYTYNSTDQISMFGSQNHDVDTNPILGLLIEGINNIENPTKYFIVRGSNSGLKPEIEHLVLRNTKNVIFTNLRLISSPSSDIDNALDIDNGKAYYTGTEMQGGLKNANILIRDCEIISEGRVGVMISGIDGCMLYNNRIVADYANKNTDAYGKENGAAVKILTSKNVKLERNNIFSDPTTAIWSQNNNTVLLLNNMIWMSNNYDYSLAAIRLVNRNDGKVQDASTFAMYYNTIYVKKGTNTNETQCFVDFAGQRGGYGASAASFGNIRMKYNNFYSDNTNVKNYYLYNGLNPEVWMNNFYITGSKLYPSLSDFITMPGNNKNINVNSQLCPQVVGTADVKNIMSEFVVTGNGLDLGSRIEPGSTDDIMGVSASFNDRLYNDVRPTAANSTAWTLGAYQSTAKMAVDTIVWTNAAKDNKWDNMGNWIVKGANQELNCNLSLSSKVVAIIPAREKSKYYNISVSGYPDLMTSPTTIKYSNDLIVSKIIIEYGAAMYVTPFLDKTNRTKFYNEVQSDLWIEDRVHWMLIGPNIDPFGTDGKPRGMLSGDYYLQADPQVYMHHVEVTGTGESPKSTWQQSFSNLYVPVTPYNNFAIRVPDQYGAAKQQGAYVHRNDPYKMNVGESPVLIRFNGRFQAEALAEYDVKANEHIIMCNTFMAPISLADLSYEYDGDVVVWISDNNDPYNRTNLGSFVKYDYIDGSDLFIKPMEAFYFYGYEDKKVTLDELAVCWPNHDYKKKARQAYVMPKLSINTSIEGVGGSTVTFLYDLDETGVRSLTKLFAGNDPYTYTHVPDVFCDNDQAYQRQAFSDLNSVFGLGINMADTATVKFTITGADQFEEVYLDDKEQGITYNLKTDEVPAMVLSAGMNEDRFVVRFANQDNNPTTDVDNRVAEKGLKVYTEDNQHAIVSAPARVYLKEISIVDMSGRVMKTMQPSATSYVKIDMSSYAAGIYTVKATTENETKSAKIVIK